MEKLWYAVLRDENDCDWGYGSFDFAKAQEMLKGMESETAYIAVIDGNYDDNGNATSDPICVDEIR